MEDSKFNKILSVVLAILFYSAGVYMFLDKAGDEDIVGILYLLLGSVAAVGLLGKVQNPKFVFITVLATMSVTIISMVIFILWIIVRTWSYDWVQDWGDVFDEDMLLVIGIMIVTLFIYLYFFFRVKKDL